MGSTPTTTTKTTTPKRSHFEALLTQTTQSTTTPSKWAAAATPTALARAALALRAPAPATNKPILSPTDLSVPSPASTTMAQHHLGVHHHRLSQNRENVSMDFFPASVA